MGSWQPVAWSAASRRGIDVSTLKLLGLAVIAVSLFAALQFWLRSTALDGTDIGTAKAASQVYNADQKNDKRIAVKGWNRSELDQIISDFADLYGLSASSDFRIEQIDRNYFNITFPNDVPADRFYFLVNYIQYPSDFDLEGRDIHAAGHATLNRSFNLPDVDLLGKAATFYVPIDDSDYDLVYGQLTSGRAYEISFTNLTWKPVSNARKSPALIGL
jgi:hypothetical protein